MDGRTDRLLQAAVRESFEGATILSVAHRLDTVIEDNRIFVMGDGRVVEFGRPCDLLRREGGCFRGMVEDTGKEMAGELRR